MESGIPWVLMCMVPSFSFGMMRIVPAGCSISAASMMISVLGFFCLMIDV